MSGIRPGDLLRTANRRALRNRHDLQLALDQSRGRALALEITRGARPMKLRLTPPH
jgi:S1-C subfamily serine protease